MMISHIDKSQKDKNQAIANEYEPNDKKLSLYTIDQSPALTMQRKLQKIANESSHVKKNARFQEMANNYSKEHYQSIQQKKTNTSSVDFNNGIGHGVQNNKPVFQRLVGAAHPIAGHDQVLPGNAATRNEAAMKIAKYINSRARETAPNVHESSSTLGANNAGNLYVISNYTVAQAGDSSLETWSELTVAGGGYVKRVRVIEIGVTIMDRVMNDPAATVLNVALAADAAAAAPAGAAVGNRQYGSVHHVNGADAASLDIAGNTAHTADNITKIVGEGARFGWLAEQLSNGTIGNTSKTKLYNANNPNAALVVPGGVFDVTVTIPQQGKFTMNPSFQQLWGAWDSAFGKAYMKDKKSATSIVQDRLRRGLRTKRDGDIHGAARLAHGATAAGQVTSLCRQDGTIALISEPVGTINSASIITDLAMTWHSEL